MAAPVILVEAQPRRADDGVAVTVRLAGAGGALPYFYGGEHWRAGLDGLPASIARLDFDGEQPGGGGVAQAIEFAWAPASRAALAELAALVWKDAPIVVRVGPEGAALPPIVNTGIVLDAAIDRGVLKVPLADRAADLKRPLLVDRYAGTGGIEGPVEWKDRIKRRAWGQCFNVLGQLIDKANNIWVFADPRRSIQAFDQLRDRGVAATSLTLLAWQGSAEATFAALAAATVPAGGAVLCPSIAAVKWWTTPSGDLRADLRGETAGGYVATAPEIAERIVAARSTLTFAAGEIAAAVSARPAPFGWLVESDTATSADQLSQLLGDVSLSWLLIDDAIVLRRWDWTASQRVARSHAVTRRTVYKPINARRIGYRRNWAPMQRSDIGAAVFARDIPYNDGTTVEALKPAEAAATNSADPDSAFGPDGTVMDELLRRVALQAAADDLALATSQALVAQLRADARETARKARDAAHVYIDGLPIGVAHRNEVNERQEGQAQIVETIDQVSVRITGVEADTEASITHVETLIVEEGSARAEQLSLVNARVTTTQQSVEAEVLARQTAVATEHDARAEAIQIVSARVDGVETDTAAEITRIDTAFADEHSATAQSFVEVAARFDGVEADTAAEITRIDTAIADETSARAQALEVVEASVNGVSGQITDLREVIVDAQGGVNVKAVLGLNAAGKVVGIVLTNNGTTGVLDMLFDSYVLRRPNGTALLYNDGDTLYLGNVVVDRLASNTAMVPVRSSSSTTVAGQWATNADITDDDNAKQELRSAAIYMPKPGWVEATFGGKQGFSGTDTGWELVLDRYGVGIIEESRVGGRAPQDGVQTSGSFYVSSPGTCVVRALWQGRNNADFRGRTLFLKGFPGTS